MPSPTASTTATCEDAPGNAHCASGMEPYAAAAAAALCSISSGRPSVCAPFTTWKPPLERCQRWHSHGRSSVAEDPSHDAIFGVPGAARRSRGAETTATTTTTSITVAAGAAGAGATPHSVPPRSCKQTICTHINLAGDGGVAKNGEGDRSSPRQAQPPAGLDAKLAEGQCNDLRAIGLGQHHRLRS